LAKFGKRIESAMQLMKLLYKQPIVDRQRVEKALGFSTSTAARWLLEFERLGILREMTGFSRNRRYAFGEYIDIFK
jgi:DNA-binding IclR family transcriptional regulator